MRFFSFFLAFLVTVFFPLNASSPSANSAQQPVAINKIIEAWEGKFADETLLTRKKLEELLATHREWLETFKKKLDKEEAKARATPTSPSRPPSAADRTACLSWPQRSAHRYYSDNAVPFKELLWTHPFSTIFITHHG
jgi:hypothetical protein